MPQPYPQPSNFSGSVDLVKYANSITNGWLASLFLLVAAAIIFMAMTTKGYRTSDSFAVASTLTLLLASFLWAAGVIIGTTLMTLVVATICGILWSIFDQ